MIEVPLTCTSDDVDRLREAGYAPVLRWVNVENQSDTPLKTVEVLTLLDRTRGR
jgi:hypothetical protein